jgi:HEPN domain-containing protein
MSRDASGWLEKARGDLDVVRRSLVPMPEVNLEAAAYHLQQAAEKSLKGLLVHLGLVYPRGAPGTGTMSAFSQTPYLPVTSSVRKRWG